MSLYIIIQLGHLEKVCTKKILTEARIYNQLTINFNPLNKDRKYTYFNDLFAIIDANLKR
jgi:hypothetical protein